MDVNQLQSKVKHLEQELAASRQLLAQARHHPELSTAALTQSRAYLLALGLERDSQSGYIMTQDLFLPSNRLHVSGLLNQFDRLLTTFAILWG